jgi:hypothetical protein
MPITEGHRQTGVMAKVARSTSSSRRARSLCPLPAPGVEQVRSPVALPSGHAKAAIALSRRNPDRSKLPRGQRWKERRLPKVCWGRKLPRTEAVIPTSPTRKLT